MEKKNSNSRRNIKDLMPLLALDASSDYLVVALAASEIKALGVSEYAPRTHQEKFIGAIDSLLKKAALTIEDIKTIAVGIGPGSYTGMRVGVTAAKTFSQALGVPLIPIDSLMMQAASLYLEIRKLYPDLLESKIAIISDAKRKEYYFGLYLAEDCDEHIKISYLRTPEVLNIRQVKEYLKSMSSPSFFVGCDFDLKDDVRIFRLNPQWEGLLECAFAELEKGKTRHWREVLPLYLRASYAEERIKE